jgi:PAS domain S-box-containing protein
VTVSRNIPSQQKAEDAEREIDAKFHILAELTESAIFIYQGMNFKYVNPATEKLTGYSRQELLEMKFNDIFLPKAKKSTRNLAKHVQPAGTQSSQGEYCIRTKSGEERWIDLTTTTIDFEKNKAILGTAFDITKHKRAEVLQDAVYRIAQAADRLKSLDDLLPAVHAIIAEVMTAENFYIALYDKDRNLLSFPYFVDEVDIPPQPSRPGRGLSEYVLRTGKSLLVDLDLHDELCNLGEIELVGVASPIWLGIPLIVDGDALGVMVVQHYTDPKAYGDREKRILEFVSSQVAMVINRKRSEEAMRESEERYHRRADELAALYETTRDLATQRDLNALLNTVADRVTTLLKSPGCTIYLYSKERRDLEAVISRGLSELVGVHLQLGEGIAGKVAQTLQPMVIDDHRIWVDRSPKFTELKAIAVAEVPMVFNDELIGVLTVFEIEGGNNSQERKYTQADLELLTVFAGTAAVAVHNTRLFDETQHRLLELEVLYQTSLAAIQINNVHEVAHRIIETIEQLMKWESSSIWLVDTVNQKPTLLVHSQMGLTDKLLHSKANQVNAMVSDIDQKIVELVCKSGRTMRTGDVKTVPNYVGVNIGSVSELCVPLIMGGNIIGCINIESGESNAFSEHDERLLTTLANQAAVAIENARLFEETHRRAIRQAALNAIITVSTRAGTDPVETLNATLEQTLKALGLDMGAIWLSWSSRGIQRMASKNIPQSIINNMMANVALTAGYSQTRTMVVDDWRVIERNYSDVFVSMGVVSTIVVPLFSEEKRIGGMAIASSDSHHWSAEEIALVEAIGSEVGSAAERAKLFEETTVRLEELEAVNKVLTSLRLAQSLQDMLLQLMEETLKILGVDTGGIWLFNSERGKLCQEIGRGWCTKIANLELDRGESLPGNVFAIGDIYFSHDVAQDSLTSPAMRELIPPGWSAICLPIHSEQEPIGVLMASTPLPQEFTSENARLLVTLTEFAGIAIHRTRLNEQLVHHAAELEVRVAERTAELQTALQKAQATDRLKSEFIINVNHELRTPLTNLVLYYQMLRKQPSIKTEERLNVIGRELQRLRNLIEELLNLSRFDLGQVTIHPVQRDLNALVLTLLNDRRSLAEEHGLVLNSNLQSDLTPVWMDESTIVQALSNLLTNAMNYTPRGGKVLVTTMTEVLDNNTWVGFRIQDTGRGIDSVDFPHLFERFYRGKAGHDSGAPGTGLGLSIVKQIVEHHKGRIIVENGPGGRGAAFTIWLPQKQETD